MVRALLVALALSVATPGYAQIVSPGGGPSAAGLVVATTGPVSVTGNTVETNLAALKIPAGSMGPNGMVKLECLWTYTNSANNKTMTVRLTSAAGATSGGAVGSAFVATASLAAQTLIIIRNNNSASSQTLWTPQPTAPYASAGAGLGTIAANTAADTYLNINGTLALGTETITMQHCMAIVSYAP
jgi:hypothetical protein